MGWGSSQKRSILYHLKIIGPITPLEALERYGCFRLGARIYDLRREGYAINKRMVIQGKRTRFAEYFLTGKIKEG